MADKLIPSAIERAMADAVFLASVKGITNPVEISRMIEAARERAVKDHVERAEIAKARKDGRSSRR